MVETRYTATGPDKKQIACFNNKHTTDRCSKAYRATDALLTVGRAHLLRERSPFDAAAIEPKPDDGNQQRRFWSVTTPSTDLLP
ncbi:hypothetical protein LSTR_LSTR008209 [Laodelphax striatellus]|uniref:Uncharacterized protein n=1 Tax=Laodelphax striatellus TaxID=195883 RepID=A0A482WJ94_LAOST|nr:hypothetical protein LSTR_LSTR008209 [Laodelphax striatellus]